MATATKGRIASFITRQREAQIQFRNLSTTFSDKSPGRIGDKTYPFAIPPNLWRENLEPAIRQVTEDYFREKHISWHRMRSHLLSSQICCLNFLMPFANQPEALAALLRPIFPSATMMPIEDDRYVAFEWISEKDHLNEGRAPDGKRTRGANCTSVDGAVKLRQRDGTICLVLIEWKYTEAYGTPPDPTRQAERLRRYSEIAFDPGGPLRSSPSFELYDLFYEPFYQFLRQQMLAFHAGNAHECGCDRAVVLHIAPKGNIAFQKITVPKLYEYNGNAVSVWKSLLINPNDFLSATTAEIFGTFDASPFPQLSESWAYTLGRYGSLLYDNIS